ncbi:MAG: hypothetical protein SWH61_07715 [Thermodesulfobacteriota bacterium]|nr:hypothetical protein [Thermodesulfobacteriota bacterium]
MKKITLVFLVCFLLCGHVDASYKDNIGFVDLRNELGTAMPDGVGIDVTQVEGLSNGHWMPDTTHSEFTGKIITDKSGGDTGSSGHATSVGWYFYGNSLSMSPGIIIVDVYRADHWLQDGFLNIGSVEQPESSSHRVANHSYVSSFGNTDLDSQALRRLDWVIDSSNYIQCVGLKNTVTGTIVLGSAFNVITVGCMDGSHSRTTVPLSDSYADTVYEPVRIKPDVVVPMETTSAASSLGASAAALLLDAGDGITNADNAEVIRATLMAGADRTTDCQCDDDYIGDYRADGEDRTDNGLDKRFGAGQINIQAAYHIIAAGEQDSGSAITEYGFDYNPAFGALEGSSDTATYYFSGDTEHSRISVALVWHVAINGGTSDFFYGDAAYYDMDLVLYDATAGQTVATGASAWDNTENIWTPIIAGHAYEIRVQPGNGQADFLWDYALAWRLVENATDDLDGDGLPDTWEIQHGLDPSDITDAMTDNDAPEGDGLTNLEEYCRGTDPINADTDGDGINDGEEFLLWQNSCEDSDEDGLPNLIDPDADNDLINDGPEYDYWGAEWDKDVDEDGLYNLVDPDSDNDGYPDGTEIARASDPSDPASHPRAAPSLGLVGFLVAMLAAFGIGVYARRYAAT